VGVIPYPYEFKRDTFEVEEIFDVAIDDLTRAAVKEEMLEFGGQPVKVLTYDINGRIIWGATAWILAKFLEILRNVSEARCNS
jgi:hypothetical protein